MSHKTGKRVLATSATTALAFAGLISMPLAANAATSATVTNVCGGGSAELGLDYVTFPAGSGVYTLQGVGDEDVLINASGTETDSNADLDPADYSATPAAGLAYFSSDRTKVNYYLTEDAYEANANGPQPLRRSFAVYDESTQLLDRDTAGTVNDATCQVTSIPAPTSKLAATAPGGIITVTKGTGIRWTITAGETAVTPASAFNADTKELKWPEGAGPNATQVLTVADATSVTLTAAPAAGYTGITKPFTFVLDGRTQAKYVAPIKNDRDGKDSDTFTVQNIPGVDWYYLPTNTTATWEEPEDSNDTPGIQTDEVTAATTANTTAGWQKITFQAGEKSATITRPAAIPSTGTPPDSNALVPVRAMISDLAKFKWDAAGTNVDAKVANQTFTDAKVINALPAPEMVDGDGATDYYVLPQVDGVTWMVTPEGGSPVTYASNDPRLGTQIPVYTYGAANPPVTYTFTAAAEADKGYQFDNTKVTTKTWTKDYDSRAQITPEGPQFHDMTGLVEDSVTFPALAPGMTGYKVAIGTNAANAAIKTAVYVDGSWYGKKVLLTELQRSLGGAITDTHVVVSAVPNDNLYTLALDAEGNPVKSSWAYTFTNAVNVVPEPPVMDDQPGTANDTLTFPVDPKVIYKVTQNGVTKTVPFYDLGKALKYTGQVTVRVEAAQGYQLQPNSDGSAPTPWVFTFDASNQVVPSAPQSHDMGGSDQDTYEIPAQPGVLWTVDGVDLDPSEYGKRISTGGKDKITFVARAANGYQLADDAEMTFTLNWDGTGDPDGTDVLGDPAVDSYVLDNGWQAHVEWSGPEGAEGLTYDVSFAKVTYDQDGNESVGTATSWWSDTEATEATFNGGGDAKYRVYVKATNGDGAESGIVTTDIVFTQKPSPTAGWVDINNSTVTQSGWLQAASSAYFDNTAFVTYKDQSSLTFSVSGGKSLDLYGTQYTKGGMALIQVDGKNWAWMDSGSDSNADPYKKLLRHIGLPDTGTHTIKIIASLSSGKELALDAYQVNK